ncbi:13129_t:CDS:2, partial [Funneliformis geosporum]
QSAFNPVEKAMATLFKKLARISFLIDKFGKYLNSQEKIFGKSVYSEYIDEQPVPLLDVTFKTNAGIDDSNNKIAEQVPW